MQGRRPWNSSTCPQRHILQLCPQNLLQTPGFQGKNAPRRHEGTVHIGLQVCNPVCCSAESYEVSSAREPTLAPLCSFKKRGIQICISYFPPLDLTEHTELLRCLPTADRNKPGGLMPQTSHGCSEGGRVEAQHTWSTGLGAEFMAICWWIQRPETGTVSGTAVTVLQAMSYLSTSMGKEACDYLSTGWTMC